jgi:hypothetical protein
MSSLEITKVAFFCPLTLWLASMALPFPFASTRVIGRFNL